MSHDSEYKLASVTLSQEMLDAIRIKFGTRTGKILHPLTIGQPGPADIKFDPNVMSQSAGKDLVDVISDIDL